MKRVKAKKFHSLKHQISVLFIGLLLLSIFGITLINGLFLEKFDDNFKVEATIRCDSAFYFKNDKLWRLDGNVVIRNTKKELIETEQIYWDQTFHEVRSDSFVHIERADRILEGYGFKSDENLHNYLVKKPSGIFPIPKRQETTPPV